MAAILSTTLDDVICPQHRFFTQCCIHFLPTGRQYNAELMSQNRNQFIVFRTPVAIFCSTPVSLLP